MDERRDDACCFDELAGGWARRARRRGTVAGLTRHLLAALEDAGLRERTVLDVGCGVGDLAVEAVRRGAAGASGFDLAASAVAEARALARDSGMAERIRFEVGDGAKVELPAADVVVLNRVFCCYPDVAGLLARSLGAARTVYAFTIPRSSGVGGALVRGQTWLANRWRALRPSKFGSFRVFVHDLGPIDAAVRAAGFSPVRRERRGLAWDLAVYSR